MAPDDLYPRGTTVAVSGGESGWTVGNYFGFDRDGRHVITIGETGVLHAASGALKGPGQIYIDSRGVAMEPMSFSEALEAVHGMAAAHQPQHNDDPANDTLSGILEWQRTALATVEDMVVNHSGDIDGSFVPPVAAGEWPEEAVGCASHLDPEDPVQAIRICLELGESGIAEHRDNDPAEADAIDRARQACDLVRDLVGAHAGDLSSRITTVRAPQGPG